MLSSSENSNSTLSIILDLLKTPISIPNVTSILSTVNYSFDNETEVANYLSSSLGLCDAIHHIFHTFSPPFTAWLSRDLYPRLARLQAPAPGRSTRDCGFTGTVLNECVMFCLRYSQRWRAEVSPEPGMRFAPTPVLETLAGGQPMGKTARINLVTDLALAAINISQRLSRVGSPGGVSSPLAGSLGRSNEQPLRPTRVRTMNPELQQTDKTVYTYELSESDTPKMTRTATPATSRRLVSEEELRARAQANQGLVEAAAAAAAQLAAETRETDPLGMSTGPSGMKHDFGMRIPTLAQVYIMVQEQGARIQALEKELQTYRTNQH